MSEQQNLIVRSEKVETGNDATRAQAWVALLLSGLSSANIVKLLRAFETPDAVFAASRASWRKVLTESAMQSVREPDADALARTLAWLEDAGHHLITWEDDDYPPTLLELNDAPPVLFYQGRRSLLSRPALAVVGSRNASPQGVENARAFSEHLSRQNVTIVSGLAAGIDAAAHLGGLSGAGSSLAVIGTGPDRVYPAQNRDLAHKLAEKGGILSEFIPGTPPMAANFPRRNRIISALSQGVLVVEASLSSGSLITARLAGEQGRDVFAIPGSIHSPFSKGCHKLIREGAKLVETAQDILDELPSFSGVLPPKDAHVAEKPPPSEGKPVVPSRAATPKKTPAPKKSASSKKPASAPQTSEEDEIMQALGFDPVDMDTLVARTGKEVNELLAKLAELELFGRVSSFPGGKWMRHD
ncbi:MAG: DNA-processing protein DprA [Burkholderiales bacterium]|jgi:DNA processing protein|nr:DNA-processing protein DprA [Burkholderiales bacterium]